ncbi:hypothetical protein TRFO_39748 [Tritrichomonas foetus]|uniref:RCC1-like domain-containing protein n=1 Tax=Tritrichomonas foetus TaxID=1144522 RepID=A0A1J4J7A6_9EUKA|nr:hypothetical protein TRFO_39748 [Tritrichomonas foetus]|eukprot:OHS94063.1 hypothetical protein TRFO_39748 [Tritrichomonas foetus]
MAVVSAGSASGSRLGRGGEPEYPAPIEIDTNEVICLAVGWRHNIILYEDGSAVGWGNNEDNQLGVSCTETLKPMPLLVFEQYKLSWVHCGDKITVVLTDSGDVYALGSSYGKDPVRLHTSASAVYCTCGVGMVYALDSNGDIFVCSSSSGHGILYHLPEPVCDIAAGGSFCLAVTINGKAYARGTDAACGCGSNHPGDSFVAIPSLAGVAVSRVFAYCKHSVVLSRDGRIFVCGSNNDGRIGLNDAQQQTTFQQLHFFDNLRVTEVGCGDSHTVFVTEDGEVYGCGVSEDGRTFTGRSPSVKTPMKSLPLGGRASFVRCGCFHSVVLVDIRRPVHPGLLFFGLLVGTMRRPRYVRLTPDLTIDVALGSITGSGFLAGDIVSSKNERGVVVGVSGDKICVKTVEGLFLLKRPSLTFEGRKGCVPREYVTRAGVKMVVDANPTLCNAFGFGPNDEIIHPTLGKGGVAGYANGTIWFHFESLNNHICRCKDTTLGSIHSIIKITKTPRNIEYLKCNDDIEYPIIITEKKNVHCNDTFGEVVGELGVFYCVKDLFDSDYKLIEKKNCFMTQVFGDYRQFDIVKTEEGIVGTIMDCNERSISVLTQQALLESKPTVVISKIEKLLCRVVGEGTTSIFDGRVLNVGACSFVRSGPIPGDIFATKKGFVRIIGSENGQILCTPTLSLETFYHNQDTSDITGNKERCENEKDLKLVEKFDESGSVLLIRYLLPSLKVCPLASGGSVELSIFFANFAGLSFLPGDEIEIGGQNFIIFGCKGGYLWMKGVGEKGLRFYNPRQITSEMAKLVARPTSHFDIFLE